MPIEAPLCLCLVRKEDCFAIAFSPVVVVVVVAWVLRYSTSGLSRRYFVSTLRTVSTNVGSYRTMQCDTNFIVHAQRLLLHRTQHDSNPNNADVITLQRFEMKLATSAILISLVRSAVATHTADGELR